ncbi:MAG TPA: aldehyde dehydrogenase family protein [Mycobacteriales bacterium]|nr:aldehyde dehydrogenase family protein [Mycobacteriales bacterium]
MVFASTNPATGKLEASFETLDAAGLEARIAAAAAAFAVLRRLDVAERAALMSRAADLLAGSAAQLGPIVTAEMGKPLAQAEAEVAKSAAGMRFYAEHAAAFLADEPVDAAEVGASAAYRVWQPLGPILAVMPWNYPIWQVLRFAAPALTAGNTVLLKHAENVPRTAAYLEDLFGRAGFPAGAFASLHIEVPAVADVLADPRVRGATLTGSEAAGRSVAALAGQHLKKTVLELGGSDPFVVLPSADLDRAASVGVKARTQNTGQSCIAAKRFIVHTDVYDGFVERFVRGTRALVVGDPRRRDTDIGPVVSEAARDRLQSLVDDAVGQGARVLCGGTPLEGPGWWFAPTVLAGVTGTMRIHREEAFGPVATLYRAQDLDDALAKANDTPFGLGASVWTADAAERRRCVAELESGAVFVNGMTASYAQLPFGGVKNSGFGTELSELGMREFCVPRTVWVA